MKNDFAKIQEEIDAMQPELVRIRRDLHRFPETGWLEMRTTAILAKALRAMGYETYTGRAVCKEGARLGLPDEAALAAHAERALAQGAPEDELTQDVLTVFAEACDGFDQMREREGEKLAEDVRNHACVIETLVGEVEKRSPERVAEYREKLLARMREVLESTDIDETRIVTEAAIYADKTAVDEETVRLRSHLHQLDGMLNEVKPVGRKLDFLVQEMNREANTIGSKANDVEMAQTVVNIKSEIEKIREQIQNIE